MQAFLAVLALALSATALAQDRAGALELVAQAEHSLVAGRPVEALRALRRAEEAGKSLQDSEVVAAAANGFGELYTQVAQFERARTSFQHALGAAGAAGGDATAAALNGLARIDLYGTRYQSAGRQIESALAMGSARPATRAATLLLASEHAARSGDLQAARSWADKAGHAAAAAGALGEARVAAQLARLAARGAAFREAFERWNAVLGQFRALGAAYDLADAMASLADLWFQLGLVAESKPRLEEARRLYAALGNAAGEARALVRLARAEQRLHRPDLALAHTEAALAAARKAHDYVTEAEALVELGSIWVGEPVPQLPALPNPDVAVRHLRAAREIYKDAGDRGAGAWVWLRTSAIQLRAQQFRVAALAFGFVSTTARELGDDDLLWQSLRGEALAAAGQDDLPVARQRMEEAIGVLEAVYARTAGLSQEARSSFLGDRRGLYEEYVELLIRLKLAGAGGEVDVPAFEASERAKSRQFAEMLAAGGAERAAASGPPRLRELVARERAVRNDLAQIMRALAAPGAQARDAGNVAERAAQLSSAHAALLEHLRGEFPRYAELLQPGPARTADVQAALQPGETLLSYFVGPRYTAVFVLDRASVVLVPVAIRRAELRRLVDRLRQPFSDAASVGALARWSPLDAHRLYQRVLEPADRLIGQASALMVAGDDALYTLPLEMLVRSAPSAAPGDPGAPRFAAMASLDWVGDRYSITYVPSAAALRALRAEHGLPSWRDTLVALADPDFGGTGVSTARGLPLAGRDTALVRLPETADEARAVSTAVKGSARLLLQREASETQLMGLDLSTTRYLLFSTHGLLGGEISAVTEPALALSLVGNPPGVDGFLGMSEVLGLRLGADLVVLSACNTAGEPDAARIGEGFAGLTRSFMYAGARSLAVSHWPVASVATVALMTAFFEELAAGRGKAEALARARRRLRGTVQDGVQLAHPYFWAAFVLVGERL